MAALRKIASVLTAGIVPFRNDDERQVRDARRIARAEGRVAVAELDSARAQIKRSQAEAALAKHETDRVRAELEALHARYVELEHDALAARDQDPHAIAIPVPSGRNRGQAHWTR